MEGTVILFDEILEIDLSELIEPDEGAFWIFPVCLLENAEAWELADSFSIVEEGVQLDILDQIELLVIVLDDFLDGEELFTGG